MREFLLEKLIPDRVAKGVERVVPDEVWKAVKRAGAPAELRALLLALLLSLLIPESVKVWKAIRRR